MLERAGDLLAAEHEDVGHLQRLLHRRLDPVEAHEVGGLLDVVDDVVELGREAVDVLSVERRDEGRVEPLDQGVGDPVALLLGEQDLLREVAAIGPVLEHVLEQPRSAKRCSAPPR